jgi:acyl-CoA hydrolase
MRAGDANAWGNVHGGNILGLIDEAAWAAATKYLNKGHDGEDRSPLVAVFERLDHIAFIKPMYIGEIAEARAVTTFASDNSVEVQVQVFAENALTGKLKLTNVASLWYAAKPFGATGTAVEPAFPADASEPVRVPQMRFGSEEERASGLDRFNRQQQQRVEFETTAADAIPSENAELIQVLHPCDCHRNGVAPPGVVLKMMDTAAALATMRHCRSAVATTSIERVEFLAPICEGNLLEIVAWPVFNSKCSLDVEVAVFAQTMASGKNLVATAVFSFVSLNSANRPQPVPPLKVETTAERRRFDQRERRFEEWNQVRAADKVRYQELERLRNGD